MADLLPTLSTMTWRDFNSKNPVFARGAIVNGKQTYVMVGYQPYTFYSGAQNKVIFLPEYSSLAVTGGLFKRYNYFGVFEFIAVAPLTGASSAASPAANVMAATAPTPSAVTAPTPSAMKAPELPDDDTSKIPWQLIVVSVTALAVLNVLRR